MLTGTRSGIACLPLVLVKAPMRALSCLRLPKGPAAMAAPNNPTISEHHASWFECQRSCNGSKGMLIVMAGCCLEKAVACCPILGFQMLASLAC